MTDRVVLVHSPPHGEVPFRSIGLAYLQAQLRQAEIESTLRDISRAEEDAGTDFYDDIILYLSRSVGDVSDGLDPRLLMEVLHPEMFDEPLPLSRAICDRVDANFDSLAAAGDLFLFTTNIITYYFAARMAYRLRAAGKRTAVGGPSIGFAPIRDLLLRCGAFDAALQGEGERTVAALVTGLRSGSVAGIPGVSWLDDDQVKTTMAAPPLALAELPYPHFEPDALRDFVPVLGTRGCPARCAYCSEPFNWSDHRQRDPAAVVAEMDWAAARYGQENFHFHDDMINGDVAWLDQLVELLAERRGRYRWESFCGPAGFDEARLSRMRDAGCVLLKMGVQSFSPDTLRLMRRRRDIGLLESAVVCAEKLGISMHYDMLTCFPGETEAGHRQNLQIIDGIFQETDSVYFSLNPFYLAIGSDTHLNPERYGIELRFFDPDSLPGALAQTVRAAGEIPVGFKYDLPRETILRRVRELGDLLKRHNRDYLYLGQEELPEGAGANVRAPALQRHAARPEVQPFYLQLLDPWSTGEKRGPWLLAEVLPVVGGEDGLVKYRFLASGPPGEAEGAASPQETTVTVRLVARNDDKPCLARTQQFNVFYDLESAAQVRQDQLDTLLRVVVKLIGHNEGRLQGADSRPGS